MYKLILYQSLAIVLSSENVFQMEVNDEADGDDKWRPMLLTLGLLYKLQKVQTQWYYNQVRENNIKIQMQEFFSLNLNLNNPGVIFT